MSTKSTIPDAWDDDWEALADKQEDEPSTAKVTSQQPPKKISKAERRAQQEELNKQLWQEADAPKTFHFLESRTNVPLKSDIKPAVKLLSRKANQSRSPAMDPASAMENLKINDSDSDEEHATQPTMTAEERRIKIEREHMEKQRKYAEARDRILGTSTTASGTASPGNVTPPPNGSANKDRGKGKGKEVATTDDAADDKDKGKEKKLFNPNSATKPDSVNLKKREDEGKGGDKKDTVAIPIRQPMGPDGTRGFGPEHRRRMSSLSSSRVPVVPFTLDFDNLPGLQKSNDMPPQ